MRTKPAGFSGVMACVLGLVLTGCQGQSPSAPSAASASHKVPSSEPFHISEIVIGKGAEQKGAPLTSADPIVVSFKTAGTTKGAELEAKLFDLSNGQVAGTETKKIVAEAAAETEVVFKNPRWNPGRYLLEVKLDNKLVEQRDIDIAPVPLPPAK